jgi:hypothetical protein
MVPTFVICLLKINVLGPVTSPRLRLASSALVDTAAFAMSVVTVIGVLSVRPSLNEMKAALAGVLATKQTPMSAIGRSSRFVFMDYLPKGMSDWSNTAASTRACERACRISFETDQKEGLEKGQRLPMALSAAHYGRPAASASRDKDS